MLDPAHGAVRQRAVADRLREGLHALAESNGSAQELVDDRPGLTAAERGPIRVAHLAEHLLLCEDRRVEPARHEHDALGSRPPRRTLKRPRQIG